MGKREDKVMLCTITFLFLHITWKLHNLKTISTELKFLDYYMEILEQQVSVLLNHHLKTEQDTNTKCT